MLAIGTQQAPETAIAAPQVTPQKAEGASLKGSVDKPGENPVENPTSPRALLQGQYVSPLNGKAAISTNTAAMFAGPKSLGREWVFEGGFEKQVDPLFGQPEQAQPETGKDLEVLSKGGDARVSLIPTDAAAGAEMATDGKSTDGKSMSKAHAVEPGFTKAAMVPAPDGVVREMHVAGAVQGPLQRSVQGSVQETTERTASLAGLSGSEFVRARAGVHEGSLDSGNGGHGGGNQGAFESPERGRPDLKVVEGGVKGRRVSLDSLPKRRLPDEVAGGPQVTSAPDLALHVKPPVEVAGHVVKGAMSRDRLSSEALLGVSTQIRNLSGLGGGEIKLRLKPENLGELHVRVVAQGRNVGLQIRASDEQAKRVIEESMSHLKESLATQSLTLGKVDVSVASGAAFSGGSSFNGGDGLAQQHQGASQSFSDWTSQGNSQGFHGGTPWESSASDRGTMVTSRKNASAGMARVMAAGAPRANTGVNGRLDVTA